MSYVANASAVFEKIPFLGKTTFDGISDGNMELAKRNAFSIEELMDFMDVYQRIRVIRSESLAGELYCLADLYEAHPTRLTMPYAPQTCRLNTDHVPTNMRHEAQKPVRRANYTWWGSKEIYRYRFEFTFPALVPYGWTVQLFRRVMHTHVRSDSVHPEEIIEMSKIVLGSVPRWVPNVLGHLDIDHITGTSTARSQLVPNIKPSSI
jgi:hypothetical protein